MFRLTKLYNYDRLTTDIAAKVVNDAGEFFRMKPEAIVKISEIAKHFGVSVRTVQCWVTDKGMPAYQPGRSYLFRWDEVEEWFKGCKHESNDADSG